MEYLWTEDTGAGLHFWKLLSEIVFNGSIIVESKGSNQGILDAIAETEMHENDTYYIAFDCVYDNQDIRNKYRLLRSMADRSRGKIKLIDIICFEYLILAFDKLVKWTGTGKADKITVREKILSSVDDHRIDISKINDEKTLEFLARFKNFSTERVIKSLLAELTENEKWSVSGGLMGECWYKDCCISEHTYNRRCGIPEVKDGIGKMRALFESDEIQRMLSLIG